MPHPGLANCRGLDSTREVEFLKLVVRSGARSPEQCSWACAVILETHQDLTILCRLSVADFHAI